MFSKLAVPRNESLSDNAQFYVMMLISLEAFIGQSGLRGRCSRKRTTSQPFDDIRDERYSGIHVAITDQIINDSSIEYIEIVNAEAFFSMFDHL